MLKKIVTPILVTVFGILLSLLIIELGYRLITKKEPSSWSDRPNSYYIHEASSSFQDLPYTAQKPEGTYRIAVIGDSFTFAPFMQFDDAFPKRLERMLNLNATQPKVEVINYGVPSYSTSHEVPIVKKAIQEGADLILMQITFNDPEIKPYTPEQLHRDSFKFGELKLTSNLYKYWRSLGFVKRRLHNNITHENYVKKFFDLFERKRTWANFSNSWRTIRKITEESKTPIAAVVFPLYGLPLDSKYPFHPIHKKVKDLLDSLKVPSLDLFTVFEGIPLERIQAIVGQDFHPNEIGHRIAAESILAWWKRQEMVPKAIIPKSVSSERIGIRKPGSPSEALSPAAVEAEGITDEGDPIEESPSM